MMTLPDMTRAQYRPDGFSCASKTVDELVVDAKL